MSVQEALKNQNKEALQSILSNAYARTDIYAKTFFPDRFSLPFSDLHRQIFDVIDAKNPDGTPKYRKVVIKAPRGIGKTSIAKTLADKRIRYRDAKYIVYLGKTFDFAVQQTENIKNGMLQNKLANKLFGSIKAKNVGKEYSETFSKKAWITSSGTMVFPRGAQQPVRGLLFDFEGFSYRPNLIIVDDLEDKDEIANDEFRKKLKTWFFADVVKSTPLTGVSKDWQIIYIDTLKHADSLLQELLDNPEWKSVELAMCDENYHSLAPAFMSDQELQNELKEAENNPELMDVFYQERMGIPVSRKNRSFSEKMYRYYKETDAEFRKELLSGEIQTVILHDPAKTTNPTSAETAIVAVGINLYKKKIYLREVVHDFLHPDEQYKILIRMIREYRAIILGVETNSLHEFIEYPLKNALLQDGITIEFLELKPRRGTDKGLGKIQKISGLIPLYQAGIIYHNENYASDIEDQLNSFPRGKLVDVADVFSYIVQVLDTYFVYFYDSNKIDKALLEYDMEHMEEHSLYENEDVELSNDWMLMQ